MIEQLRKAQTMINEVERDCDSRGIDSMLGYCEDYISITIKEIEKWLHE